MRFSAFVVRFRFRYCKIEESEVSNMPEWLLEKLTPQQLRDLFAYLCR